VYHEFDEAAVRGLLGIGVEDRPVSLIVHGVYDMPRFAQRWRGAVEPPRSKAEMHRNSNMKEVFMLIDVN